MAGGGDKSLFTLMDGHELLRDKYQLIVRHPLSCGGRGSSIDRHKTFHHLPVLREKLDRCGVELSEAQWDQLEAIERGFHANT